MPLEFETDHVYAGITGCTLTVRQEGNVLSNYDIDINPNKETNFYALPEGSYSYRQPYCGRRQTWSIYNWELPNFRAFAGHIALVSKLDIFISDTDQLHITVQRRKYQQKTALTVLGLLGDQARSRLVSAYNGTKIDPTLFDRK